MSGLRWGGTARHASRSRGGLHGAKFIKSLETNHEADGFGDDRGILRPSLRLPRPFAVRAQGGSRLIPALAPRSNSSTSRTARSSARKPRFISACTGWRRAGRNEEAQLRSSPSAHRHGSAASTSRFNHGEPFPLRRRPDGDGTLAIPRTHTLQLLLGDADHIPHTPPVYSDKIHLTVVESRQRRHRPRKPRLQEPAIPRRPARASISYLPTTGLMCRPLSRCASDLRRWALLRPAWTSRTRDITIFSSIRRCRRSISRSRTMRTTCISAPAKPKPP